MKAYSGFVQLSIHDRRLCLPHAIVEALSLQAQTELFTRAIATRCGDEDPLEPDLTLIASALPSTAWGRLLRGSFSLPPGFGPFQGLLDKLERLRLYPRNFAVEEAAPRRELDAIPAVLLMFEIPIEERRRRDPKLKELYDALARGARASVNNGRAATLLSRALSKSPRAETAVGSRPENQPGPGRQRRSGSSAEPGSVNWISSMQVLNSLAVNHDNEPVHSMTLRSEGPLGLSMALDPWRSRIWPLSRGAPQDHRLTSQSPVFVLATADEDEQTLHLRFYLQSGDRLLVEFTLLVPSGGIESFWYNWAASEIQMQKGSILFARTTARIERRWVKLRIAAVFPDGTRCAHSLRMLQGKLPAPFHDRRFLSRSFMQVQGRLRATEADLGNLPHRLDVIRDCLEDKANAEAVSDKPPQQFTSLTDVRIFGNQPKPGLHAGDDNPYVFTRPYDKNHRDARTRLCEQILDSLLRDKPEHALIVGGHRTGKTSFLGLIREVLKARGRADDVAVVHLNMATTPPSLVFVTLVERLPVVWQARVRARLDELYVLLMESMNLLLLPLTMIVKLFLLGNFFGHEQSAGSWRPNNVPSGGARPSQLEPRERRLRGILETWNPNTDENKALLLRESAALLGYALDDGAAGRVIVVVDEFADAARWDGRWAYPAWRALIEGQLMPPDDRGLGSVPGLRWLFLSSRPLDEVASYSPLGNAVREYNLPPLSEKEAMLALRPFYERRSETLLPPLLISDARIYLLRQCAHHPYLLQVMAHHVWAAAQTAPAAVATLELVERVVEKRVLPEIGDFFARECAHLGRDCRDALRALATGSPGATLEPHQRKAIERAGLGGRDQDQVVPLLLTWIRSGGLSSEEGGPTSRAH